MKAAVDTNIIVSRTLSPSGAPAQVMKAWENQAFELVISDAVLEEYERVLSYDHIRRRNGLSLAQIKAMVHTMRSRGTLVTPTEFFQAVPADPSDNKFLECAVAGGAGYIVSGDAHLLDLREFRGIPIITPAAFLLILQSGDEAARS